MSGENRIKELEDALKDAVDTLDVCKGFIDEQTNNFILQRRANWKSAAQACFNEIDGRVDDLRDVLNRGK